MMDMAVGDSIALELPSTVNTSPAVAPSNTNPVAVTTPTLRLSVGLILGTKPAKSDALDIL